MWRFRRIALCPAFGSALRLHRGCIALAYTRAPAGTVIRRFPVRLAESVRRSTLTRNYTSANYGEVEPPSRQYFATCCLLDTLLEGKMLSKVDVTRAASSEITRRRGFSSSGQPHFSNHLSAGVRTFCQRSIPIGNSKGSGSFVLLVPQGLTPWGGPEKVSYTPSQAPSESDRHGCNCGRF